MVNSSSRVLWKGAISFGLVHIPVALHSATSEEGIDFDWLDKRSMDPVGYKRINKKTGKEIDKENIVKGIEYEDGRYVVLSQEEISAAYPKTTQTIEIETFVSNSDIPFMYLDRPLLCGAYQQRRQSLCTITGSPAQIWAYWNCACRNSDEAAPRCSSALGSSTGTQFTSMGQ
jgi:Ku protein